MFNKLKQFKDLKDQAKVMQDMLAKESITVSEGGVTITMNGNLELADIKMEEKLLSPGSADKLGNAIKKAHAEALKKMQRVMAMKMKDMGGMPNIPGLS